MKLSILYIFLGLVGFFLHSASAGLAYYNTEGTVSVQALDFGEDMGAMGRRGTHLLGFARLDDIPGHGHRRCWNTHHPLSSP